MSTYLARGLWLILFITSQIVFAKPKNCKKALGANHQESSQVKTQSSVPPKESTAPALSWHKKGQNPYVVAEKLLTDIAQGHKTLKVSELPEVVFLPLSEETKNNIRKHPLYEKFSHMRKVGRAFDLEIEGLLSKGVAPQGNKIEFQKFGESIQLQFIQRVFDVLTEAKTDSKREKLSLTLTDSAEIEHTYALEPGEKLATDFDMTKLKAANPTYGSIPKKALREALQIPDDRPVISVYGVTGLGSNILNGHSEVATALKEIVRGKAAVKGEKGLIFVSRAGGTDEISANMKADFPDYKILNLSQLGSMSFKAFPKLIVINDIAGRVPYLHAVSDFSIVNGPVNFFEPLSVQTPTAIFATSKAIGEYDSVEFYKLLEQAQKTGGAKAVSTPEEVIDFYHQRSSVGPITPAYQLNSHGLKTSPWDIFMKDLGTYWESPKTKAQLKKD